MKKLLLFAFVTISHTFIFAQKISVSDTLKISNNTKYYSVNINYFNFFKNKKEIKILNDSINNSMRNYEKDFISQIDDDIKQGIDSSFISGKYDLQINMQYYITKNKQLSIFITVSYYTLGAHGNLGFDSYHFDVKQSKF